MHQHVLTEVELSSTEEIAEGVFLITFQRIFDFIPGQVIGIGLEKDGPRRLYSICSGNADPEIAILYNVIEEGYLTPRLSDLVAGDSIWITEPRGEFVYRDGPGIWIATGTGIAPFYSMFRSGQYNEKVLIHGERFLERFYFFDEFSMSMGNQYIRCCTMEEDASTFNGRVTDYLAQLDRLPLNADYYLCGRAEMVVEVRDLLISRGVKFERILSEIYF